MHDFASSAFDPNYALTLVIALIVLVLGAVGAFVAWAQRRAFHADTAEERDRAEKILALHLGLFSKVIDGIFATSRAITAVAGRVAAAVTGNPAAPGTIVDATPGTAVAEPPPAHAPPDTESADGDPSALAP